MAITGANFQPAATAFFGLVSSTSVSVASGSSMTAVAPPGSGTVDIKVVNPDGQSAIAPMAFTYSTGTSSLSGRVVDVNNAGIGGVLLTVTGSHPATATTAADGSFSIPGFLTTDTYTITPSKTGYSFTPTQVSGTISAVSTVSFTGVNGTLTIGGHATYQNGGGPAAGVVVTMTGTHPGTATTGADGAYQFTGFNIGDSYGLSATKTGYFVTPQGGGLINQNVTFDFTVFTATLSGRVVDVNNAGVGGVLLTVTGSHPATATTAADGSFSIPGFLTTDTYTITPSKTGYSFTPTQVSGTISAVSTVSFTGVNGTLTIGGHATYQNGGGPAAGVVVTLTGTHPGTATTGADGAYQFTGFNIGDSYGLSATKTGYFVTPAGWRAHQPECHFRLHRVHCHAQRPGG